MSSFLASIGNKAVKTMWSKHFFETLFLSFELTTVEPQECGSHGLKYSRRPPLFFRMKVAHSTASVFI